MKSNEKPQNYDWMTPPWMMYWVNQTFGQRNLDVSCDERNCQTIMGIFKDRGQDGLDQPWGGVDGHKGKCWLNPEYTIKAITEFLVMAWVQIEQGIAEDVVAVLPVKSDQEWWNRFALRADELHFFEGRVRFWDSETQKPGKYSCSFPCCMVLLRENPTIMTKNSPRLFSHNIHDLMEVFDDMEEGRVI